MNRRKSHLSLFLRRVAIRLSAFHRQLLLPIPYLILCGWLFSGFRFGSPDPAWFDSLFLVPERPGWSAPDHEHWFGTAANGADLFEASRYAMASSVILGLQAISLGGLLALLIPCLFALRSSQNRYRELEFALRIVRPLPFFLILALLLGAWPRSETAVWGMGAIVAVLSTSAMTDWLRKREESFELTAARIVGLSRFQILRSRLLPTILPRLAGALALYLPSTILAEMALSFLGFGGHRASVGAMIAQGQEFLIEAPWMTIYPGILATGVVMAFSFLGWRSAATVRTGLTPPFS